MRTRTRTVVEKLVDTYPTAGIHGTQTVFACDGTSTSSPLSVGAYAIPEIWIDERMTDELGKKLQHPVVHRKRRADSSVSANLGTLFVQGVTNGYVQMSPEFNEYWRYYGWSYLGRAGLASFDVNTTLLHTMPSRYSTTAITSDHESVLKENCIEKARQLKADVLLNIVEGNQIWPSITSLATCLPQMKQNWRNVRKMIRTASDSYLAWKFGVSPILSDSMSIMRHLPKLASDMKRHYDQETQRFSAFAIQPVAFDTTPESSTQYGYVAYRWYPRGYVLKDPTVRYVILVKPNQSYRTDLFKRLDYMASRFATSPASFAWEKVPFSFVADWFVDIRGALRTLDKVVGFEPYDVVGFTRSYSYKLATTVSVEHRATCPSNDILVSGPVGTVEFSHYERSHVSMTANLLSWKPRFGKNQAGITAALIGQKLQSLKH